MQNDHDSLPDDVDALKALLLEKESVIAQNESVITAQSETILKQQQTIERKEQQIAQLLRKHYGPKQERIDPDQLMLFSKEEIEQVAQELKKQSGSDEDSADDQPPKKKKRKGHGRRRLPEYLPRERVVYELDEQERACPCCGELRCEIGEITSEQLEIVPSKVKVIEHVRKKYACKSCEEHVEVAAKEPQPIEKGLAGPGLLAHTVLSKYGDHLPLYRQEDILARHGVTIRRSTLCDWMAAAADLARPLWLLMQKLVLQSSVIHTDDTIVKMLSPGETKNCRFWVYIGDAAHPYSVYDFTEDRSRDGPAKFLAGYSGYLQADAYGGYDGIYSGGEVVEVACMAHCRRYWWEARTTDPRRAHEALSFIGRLYELEEQFRESKLDGDALREARQRHAVPILDNFASWLESSRDSVLPKSLIGKAFTYTLNQWSALRRYTEEGFLSIDNNVSERTVKIAAIGRKNWMFVGSRTGGERAAILFSLTASAKACGVEPQAYLTDLFRELGKDNGEEDHLRSMLPDRWLAAHPEHRWEIDALRREERRRSREARIAKRKRC